MGDVALNMVGCTKNTAAFRQQKRAVASGI
jgi:hypothetical protein